MAGIQREPTLQPGLLQAISCRAQLEIRHPQVLPRVWELRKNLTAYDAVYVALAEALEVPLLTCDANIAGAAGHRARVDVI
jgi:predicted nucleic acid-binding protein